MFIARRGLVLIGYRTHQVLKYSSSITTNYDGLTLNPKFTNEEQQKILNILNKSNSEQLSRFDVSQTRIKNLESWKNKKGPFKSLADVLEVDGLGVKVLERLCESIVTTNNNSSFVITTKSANKSLNRRQLLSPTLTNEKAKNLSSAVGLHLGPSGISWTKLCCDGNRVDSWGFYDCSLFPQKMLPTDTFRLAMSILNKIPTGEVYIFEASPSLSPQGSKQVTSYNQQLELTSMLLTLINTSPKHNSFELEDITECTNCVYHLRANLSARLFRTLVGTERVSSTATISNLLLSSPQTSLPCTPIDVAANLQKEYYAHPPMFQELLGQALLLAITFMDLCVYKNSTSLMAVAPGRK